mmetsp:Transcript_21093/g.50041  ORF Transcript_21093/g.50041 Transcript_21093/m.50041 type:complete len:309 (+) Transcript_21093:637-1563(+)
MLVYVSFSKTARSEDVEKAARTVLNLPIQTVGAWGDGVSETKSILRIASDDRDGKGEGGKGGNNVSVLLVPQANLIARVKKGGKSVQYRDQIDKETGRDLYRRFAESVESILVHRQRQQQQEGATTGSAAATAAAAPKKTGAAGATVVVDPAVPPGGYFRSIRAAQEAAADADDDNAAAVVVYYGEDLDPETGIPLEHADGTPLTKSGKKRAKKLLDAHARRHEKHLAKAESESAATKAAKGSPTEPPAAPAAPEASTTTTEPSTMTTPFSRPRLDPGFVRLVVGTFGKRQGLSLESDMGPFCHVVDL